MFVSSWTLLSLIILPAAVFAQQVEVPFVVSVWTEERPVPPSCSDEDTTHIKGYLESSIVKWASVFFNDGTLALDSPEMIDLVVPGPGDVNNGLVKPNNTFTASNKGPPDESLNARRTQIRKRSYLYSATNTYTCRLCTADNKDIRRNVRERSLFVHQHFENYMSYQVTEDLRFYTKEAIRARNGELHCLGNGEEIEVKFSIELDSVAIDLPGATRAEPMRESNDFRVATQPERIRKSFAASVSTEESVAPSSGEASSSPSSYPTIKPTLDLTDEPTQAPTPQPTDEPTQAPTPMPTDEPTQAPTPEPTQMPIPDSTKEPKTASKTNPKSPTPPPTPKPTQLPTSKPTKTPPTASPTTLPKKSPTKSPTKASKGAKHVPM